MRQRKKHNRSHASVSSTNMRASVKARQTSAAGFSFDRTQIVTRALRTDNVHFMQRALTPPRSLIHFHIQPNSEADSWLKQA